MARGPVRGRSGVLVVVGALLAPIGVVSSAGAAPAPPVVVAREVQTIPTAELGIDRPLGVAHDPDTDVLIVAGDGDRTTPVVVLDREQDVVSSTQLASGNPSTLTYDAHRDQLTLLAGGDVVGVDRSDLSRTSPLAESVGSAGRAGPDATGAAVHPDGRARLLDSRARAIVAVDGSAPPVRPRDVGDARGVGARRVELGRQHGLEQRRAIDRCHRRHRGNQRQLGRGSAS